MLTSASLKYVGVNNTINSLTSVQVDLMTTASTIPQYCKQKIKNSLKAIGNQRLK